MHILLDILGWRIQFGMAVGRSPCEHEEIEVPPDPPRRDGQYL